MAYKDAGLTSLQDLYNFENSLRRYLEELVNSTNAATHAMNLINQSWDDKVQARFMDEFVEALKGVTHMAEVVDAHQQYVHRKAQELDRYINSH